MDVPREVDLCRTFSEMLHAKVGDVDAGGWEDPQLCSDYVKDICCYLQQLEPSAETYLLAKYLMELTLVDYEMVHFNPWEIAAAALCLSGKVSSQGQWSSRLRFYPGSTEERLSLIMRHVAKNVVRVNRNLTKHLAVKKKYSSARFRQISTTPQLNCCTIKELAACWLNESKQLM